MGELGNSYHVRRTNPHILADLLAQLPKPSAIVDTESQPFIPFLTNADQATVFKLIPFPLIHYIYDDEFGFGTYGYHTNNLIFSIIVDWTVRWNEEPNQGGPDIRIRKFERPKDDELIRLSFFENSNDISMVARTIEDFERYFNSDGEINPDFDIYFHSEFSTPLSMGLNSFFNLGCVLFEQLGAEVHLDIESYPNQVIIDGAGP